MISVGFTNWVITGGGTNCFYTALLSLQLINCDDFKFLSRLKQYLTQLQQWAIDQHDVQRNFPGYWTKMAQDAISWKSDMLKPGMLSQYFGKRAAVIWLYEELKDFDDITCLFRVTLKYFCESVGRPID